jgi:hypothetical protein
MPSYAMFHEQVPRSMSTIDFNNIRATPKSQQDRSLPANLALPLVFRFSLRDRLPLHVVRSVRASAS